MVLLKQSSVPGGIEKNVSNDFDGQQVLYDDYGQGHSGVPKEETPRKPVAVEAQEQKRCQIMLIARSAHQ